MPEAPAITAPSRKALNFGFRRQQNVRRPGPITALDIEGQTLRIVQSAPRGSATAITRIEVGQLDLDNPGAAPNPEALGKAAAAVLDDLRLKPSQVVMGIPRQLVVLRTLTLPDITDVREMASIVHLQIGKELPFRLDEAVIDFQVVNRGQRSEGRGTGNGAPGANESSDGAASAPKVEVLVAAVRQETVDLFTQIAAAAKVKLVALGWLSQAHARWVDACGIAPDAGAVALVSVRPDEVGIDIVAGGVLRFSRGARLQAIQNEPNATKPGDAAPDSSAAATRALGSVVEPDAVELTTIEVVRSLHSYNGTERDRPVSRVVIAGATGQETRLLEVLQRRLNLTCELLPEPRGVDLPSGGRQHVAGSIGALGLALGINDTTGLPFDFLSPKRPAVQRNTKRIRTLAFATLGLVAFIALMATRSHFIHKRLAVSRELQKELADNEKKVPIFRRMQQQAATLQNWSKDGRNWLEQYAYLSAVLPGSEDLYLTSISVSGQGNIHLAVQARSGEILANLDRQLRAAGYEVKPLAITPGSDRHGYNFRSTVELIVPAKMKVDLGKVQTPARPADDGSLDPKRKPGTPGGRS